LSVESKDLWISASHERVIGIPEGCLLTRHPCVPRRRDEHRDLLATANDFNVLAALDLVDDFGKLRSRICDAVGTLHVFIVHILVHIARTSIAWQNTARPPATSRSKAAQRGSVSGSTGLSELSERGA